MIGLIFILAAIVYCTVSVAVVRLTMKMARKRNIKGWKWGLPAGLFMYLIVFWDHIPTLVMHKYYCETEAGFWVYKTPEQWIEENPGVEKSLTWRDSSPSEQITRGVVFHLNQRLDLKAVSEPRPLSLVGVKKREIVDQATNQILAEKVDVSAGIKNISLGYVELRDYKFWLSAANTCFDKHERSKWLHDGESFIGYSSYFKKIGAQEKE